jgi:hypothetical protein
MVSLSLMGIEQRKQTRLNVSMNALVKGVDRFGLPFDESTSAQNISRGGLMFVTKRELEPGAPLDITIPRPPLGRREQAPFFTTGQVVRIIPSGDEFQVAVHFTGPQFRTYVGETGD